MPNILYISIQKLFLISIVLKVISSAAAWYFSYIWSMGVIVPLIVMSSYIAIGLNRKESDVSDEKFADSCYYMGFIFTITSIILSLFDLPEIETKLQDIAVRFGAAMISTVFGLAVRVYLVSFKIDVADALENAETGVIEAAHRFREQLILSAEKSQDFQATIDEAAHRTVLHVNEQIESLSIKHGKKLAELFSVMAAKNQDLFTQGLLEISNASLRFSKEVDAYSNGLSNNLDNLEKKVNLFSANVATRLTTTTFPDDFFSSSLERPLGHLSESANHIASSVINASEQISGTTKVIEKGLKSIRSKADKINDSFDVVNNLALRQEELQTEIQSQLVLLNGLVNVIDHFESKLSSVHEGLINSNSIISTLSEHITVTHNSKIHQDKIQIDLFSDLLSKFNNSTASINLVNNNITEAFINTTKQIGSACELSNNLVSKIDELILSQYDSKKAVELLLEKTAINEKSTSDTMLQLKESFNLLIEYDIKQSNSIDSIKYNTATMAESINSFLINITKKDFVKTEASV